MDTKITVASLIQGSNNIDQMRSEIDRIVSMVIGMALHCPFQQLEQVSKTFRFGFLYRWDVVGHMANGRLSAKCFIKDHHHPNMTMIYSTVPRELPLRKEDIKSVYEGLQVFVDGMLEEFHGLADKLAPIVEASKVTFPSVWHQAQH